MKLQRIHIKITGRVQGVGFRHHTFMEAQKMGLVGWVRNLSTGEVEVRAEGPQVFIQHFLEWCHQGPPHASVTRVDELENCETESLSFTAFLIERTE